MGLNGRYEVVSSGGLPRLEAAALTLDGHQIVQIGFYGFRGHTYWMVSGSKLLGEPRGEWDGVTHSYPIPGADAARREMGPALLGKLPADWREVVGSFLGTL